MARSEPQSRTRAARKTRTDATTRLAKATEKLHRTVDRAFNLEPDAQRSSFNERERYVAALSAVAQYFASVVGRPIGDRFFEIASAIVDLNVGTALFIDAHQPAVAGHIGRQNGCKSSLNSLGGQNARLMNDCRKLTLLVVRAKCTKWCSVCCQGPSKLDSSLDALPTAHRSGPIENDSVRRRRSDPRQRVR